MSAESLISTSELCNKRVVGGKNGTARIGKVRSFVFHPTKRRCVGFLVKRPDVAYMFHRKDLFVSIEGYDYVDGTVVVRQDSAAKDARAKKALGIDWDACVLWIDLPVMAEDGASFGYVGDVVFDRFTGEVDHIVTTAGATANALLGRRSIPASFIRGFHQGVGTELAVYGTSADEAEEVARGALLVSDDVRQMETEGGFAQKAGNATAVAVERVHSTIGKAKPKLSEVAQKTEEVVGKGVQATGRRLVRTKNAFSEFKEEYNKASGKNTLPSSKTSSGTKGATNAVSRHSKAAGGMFSAFKEEFTKALHDDDGSGEVSSKRRKKRGR